MAISNGFSPHFPLGQLDVAQLEVNLEAVFLTPKRVGFRLVFIKSTSFLPHFLARCQKLDMSEHLGSCDSPR